MKTSYILAALTTVFGVIEAVPYVDRPVYDRMMQARSETQNGEAAGNIFATRTICPAYPCDDDVDCKVIGCAACRPNFQDVLRCN